MKDRKEIERFAEDTLNSLKGLQEVDASEYLAAKAWNSLKQNQYAGQANYNKILLRLALVMLLLTGINCASFYAAGYTSKSNNETTGSEAFAKAYNLNIDTDNY